MTKKTKIRIRKTVGFVRTTLFVIALIFMVLVICSVDGPSILFPVICAGIAVVCFGISYLLDELLFQTAWSKDKQYTFYH